MTMLRKAPVFSRRTINTIFSWLVFGMGVAFFAAQAQALQTGSISGQVTDASGAGVADVVIKASSNVLPQPRTANSAANGQYRLRLLPPGNYKLEFTFADGSQQTHNVQVFLQQMAEFNVAYSVDDADMEVVIVTGTQMSTDIGQGSLKNSIDAETFDSLPVGQNYRDLMKLIPGVQYSENEVRGPSAGGSGQDNTYQFDGVDVSMPLFGVLTSEPSSHDIAEVSVVRGGAKAIGFNRSGGFLMNTTSKSGTDEFHGEVSYQMQPSGMTSGLDTGSSLEFDEDRTWTTVSLGGPIVRDRLYFYTSYYRPDHTRDNVGNVYGPVSDFENVRDEFFGKLTYAPTDSILLHASYRTSEREVSNDDIGEFDAATASVGSETTQDVLTFEGSWVITGETSISFKYTDFENKNSSRPDTEFNFPLTLGDSLDVLNLDQQGYLKVPQLGADVDFNTFVQPLIDRYGYLDGGVATGGGAVGGYFQINDLDYFRESYEIAVDHLIYAGNFTHELHFGYQFMEVSEELSRTSNGWGRITVPGGLELATDGVTPIYYQARVQQQTLLGAGGAPLVPVIISSSEMQSIEINDSIEFGDWTYNIGVLISNDVFFGQGLARNPNNPVTGFEASPGSRYEMYEVDWSDMIQPRLGVNWDYSDRGSLYFSYARYNPSASSLARAASWDRNLSREIDVSWDASGNFIESEALASSSGKWFQDGLKPRFTNEFLVGTTRDISSELTLRAHVRHRKSESFWEDTGNSDRTRYPHPGSGIVGYNAQTLCDGGDTDACQELYVPNLKAIRDEIGGSSFVIAELDGAYTKYWEASAEVDWNRDKWFVRGSYTWSHYWGNFDQDMTTTNNDGAIFIGSSFIADGAGRQIWNFRDGNLNGDRRHILKIYGFYNFDWNGKAGAYFVYQSGEPWEKWDSEFYRDLTTSTSDTSRYAEPAGSRTTDAHWQLDLNYTHNFKVFNDQNVQLRADLFNVFDNQTGYNIQRKVNSAGFGDPRTFFKPRRLQIAVKFQY